MLSNLFIGFLENSHAVDITSKIEEHWEKIDDGAINLKEGNDEVLINNLNSVPGKLKAVIKFGFDEGFKNRVSQLGQTFDDWIDAVFIHTQAHFRHASLGTEIHFEVSFVYLHLKYHGLTILKYDFNPTAV